MSSCSDKGGSDEGGVDGSDAGCDEVELLNRRVDALDAQVKRLVGVVRRFIAESMEGEESVVTFNNEDMDGVG
jgi:hypothetical protein